MNKLSTLVELVEESCLRYADRPLLGTRGVSGFRWTTYGAFGERVAAMRAGLASLGVGAGDRVAIISNNREEWAVVACAAYGLCAQVVPLYEAQHPDEWAYILADSGAKVAFTARASIATQVEAQRANLPELVHVITFDGTPEDPRSYEALLRMGKEPPRMPAPDDVAGFIYTSGTTGKPKGVLLSHQNIISNINGVHEVFKFDPDDRSLSFLPWAHAFGQMCELYLLMSMGSSIALNRALPRLLDDMAEVEPTILIAVPRVFTRLYVAVQEQMEQRRKVVRRLFHDALSLSLARHKGTALKLRERLELALADRLVLSKVQAKFGGRLKYAMSASAALNPKVAEFIDALGIQVYEGYGLTETSPIVSANRPGAVKLGSVGKPIPGVRVEIDTSSTGQERVGELIVYGPNVMRGYHRLPEETARAFTPDGGLRTGDVGEIDDDGFLYIRGRIKEQYKLANGKYVMPSVREEELKLSPLIANVLLYGANQDYNVALVAPNEAALRARAEADGLTIAEPLLESPVARALIQKELDLCTRGFPSFERPRACRLVEDFTVENGLLTPTLKLRRNAIVERYRDELEAMYAEKARAVSPVSLGHA